jgi:hypothetical protein
MTAEQELIEQGRKQGFQQGFQVLLLCLLLRRFAAEVDPHIEQRITTASFEQLEIWSGRVLTASTLAELLAD